MHVGLALSGERLSTTQVDGPILIFSQFAGPPTFSTLDNLKVHSTFAEAKTVLDPLFSVEKPIWVGPFGLIVFVQKMEWYCSQAAFGEDDYVKILEYALRLISDKVIPRFPAEAVKTAKEEVTLRQIYRIGSLVHEGGFQMVSHADNNVTAPAIASGKFTERVKTTVGDPTLQVLQSDSGQGEGVIKGGQL